MNSRNASSFKDFKRLFLFQYTHVPHHHHHLKLIVKVLKVGVLISTNTTSPVAEKRGILISRTAVDSSTGCCSLVPLPLVEVEVVVEVVEAVTTGRQLCFDSFSPPSLSPIDDDEDASTASVCGLDTVTNRVSYNF